MYPTNLKSVALPVPKIIGGTPKIWTIPGYAHAPFSPKILMDFYQGSICLGVAGVRPRLEKPRPRLENISKNAAEVAF